MTDVRKRTALIACSGDEEQGVRWFGHLQTEGRVVEYGPDWVSPEDAMIWARERTSSIFIRLRVEGRYWWAGEGAPPLGGPPTEGSIVWLDSGLPMPFDDLSTVLPDQPPSSAAIITRAPDGTNSLHASDTAAKNPGGNPGGQ